MTEEKCGGAMSLSFTTLHNTKIHSDNQRTRALQSSIFRRIFGPHFPAGLSVFKAHAKINLGLYILGKRPDGFHTIATVFHRIDLFDELTFDPSDRIVVTSSTPEAPDGEANICFKAAALLQQRIGTEMGVRISIRKKIPVGAGLGGGSADAAAVLLALPQFWRRAIDAGSLRAIALELGSDVPYFLAPGTALAGGRGEELAYFALHVPYAILVCSPGIHISTAWAYQQLRPGRTGPLPDLKNLVMSGMKNPLALVNGLRNDFEPVVFAAHPEVMRVKEAMLRGGAEYASMSGSGSAVYGLFRKTDHTRKVVHYLQGNGYNTFLTGPLFSAD